jgi:hypothetical protein
VSTTLRISAEDRTWHGVAISRSARSALRTQRSAARGQSTSGGSKVYAPEYTDYVADQIRWFADEHADVSRERPRVVRRWAGAEMAIAAVLIVVTAWRWLS